MIDPEDAQYTCTLSPQSLARAERELFEDPKQRLGAVQALRRWIKEQPHMSCRTDTELMLQILRTAKFSQLRAREIVENLLTMKTKLPKLMTNIDSHDPGILAHIEAGIYMPLPKPDAEGRYYFLIRPGQIDFSDPLFSQENEFRCGYVLDVLRKHNNEDIIVNGEMLILDMTGCSTKHMARMNTELHREVQKVHQDGMVGRMKGFHMYNAGTFFEVIMGISRPFMKKKYLERIHVHSTMESLYQKIPMELWPDEYLPDDYTGPSAGPIKTITENLKQRILDPTFRARVLDISSDKYKIDLKAKPVDIPQASFRKLNID